MLNYVRIPIDYRYPIPLGDVYLVYIYLLVTCSVTYFIILLSYHSNYSFLIPLSVTIYIHHT